MLKVIDNFIGSDLHATPIKIYKKTMSKQETRHVRWIAKGEGLIMNDLTVV